MILASYGRFIDYVLEYIQFLLAECIKIFGTVLMLWEDKVTA